MMRYQSPVISTIRQEPFQSQLQYVPPNCNGTACNEFLGISGTCIGCGPDTVEVQFFLSGRTDLSAPTGCIIVAQPCSGPSVDGVSCNYLLGSSCAEGQVWEVNCSFGDVLNNNGFGTAFIQCDGELSTVCSGGGC